MIDKICENCWWFYKGRFCEYKEWESHSENVEVEPKDTCPHWSNIKRGQSPCMRCKHFVLAGSEMKGYGFKCEVGIDFENISRTCEHLCPDIPLQMLSEVQGYTSFDKYFEESDDGSEGD